jgi:osmotically-inducible protein OsmY
MKLLSRFLFLCLLGLGSVYAQSNLPACQGSDASRWSNCVGSDTFANGNKYVGEYKDGKRNGQFTVTFANGDKYVGEYKDDKRTGQGTYTFANGDKYVGEHKDGKLNGQGTFTFANGNKYVGEHKDGKRNGQFTVTFANGDKYVGEYKDDKRNGQGTFTSANGNKYVGEYKDDKRNGQGTQYAANGSISNEGIWADGNFVRTASVQQASVAYQTETPVVANSLVNRDRRTAGIQLEDEGIELSIAKGLRQVLSGSSHVNVSSYNRMVLLTGEVRSALEKEQAERLAKSQGNVSAVVNDLAIESPSSQSQRYRDRVTEGQLKTRLTDANDLAANAIKVIVERGIVFLMGRVTAREAERATEISRNGIASVVKVVRVFEIITEQELGSISSRINDVADAERRGREELDKRLAAAKELERVVAELDLERKKRQELEAQSAASVQPTPPQTNAPRRIAHALVIGNGAYPGSGRLDNPVNDANAISLKLRSMGFTVTTVTDANRQRLVQSMAQFRRTAASADISLLYYAGHGVQIFGTNYILPTDVDQADPAQATIQGVSLNSVVENFLPGKTKLVFLDACRDNALQRTNNRSVSKGLAPISAAEGTLISYATKDGQTAADGEGSKNSPFTQALLEHLNDPQDIAVVLRKVRERVMKITGGKQQPWEYGSLTGGELVLSAIKPK